MFSTIQFTLEPSFKEGVGLHLQEDHLDGKSTWYAWVLRGTELYGELQHHALTTPKIPIDDCIILPIIDALRQVTIPVWPAFVCGLDGEIRTLDITNGNHRITIKWWCELPQEWMVLDDVAATLELLAWDLAAAGYSGAPRKRRGPGRFSKQSGTESGP